MRPIIDATVDSKPVRLLLLSERSTGYTMQFRGSVFDVDVLNPSQRADMAHMPVKAELDLTKVVVSPISGTIKSVSVSVGDSVAPGQEIVVLEAMKMHNVIR